MKRRRDEAWIRFVICALAFLAVGWYLPSVVIDPRPVYFVGFALGLGVSLAIFPAACEE